MWTGDVDYILPKGTRAKLERLVGAKVCAEIELAYKRYALCAALDSAEPAERDIQRELAALSKWIENGQEMIFHLNEATTDRLDDSVLNMSGPELRRNLSALLAQFDQLVFVTLRDIQPKRGRKVNILERNFAARVAGIMKANNLPLSATKGIDEISKDSLLVEVLNIVLERNQPELARHAVKNPSVD